MKPTLAAGVTMDFIHAAPKSAKWSTVMVSPLFFVCSLLTRVPRLREGTAGWGAREMQRAERSRVVKRTELDASMWGCH